MSGSERGSAHRSPLGSPIPLIAERPARDPAGMRREERGRQMDSGREDEGGGERGGRGRGEGRADGSPWPPLCEPLGLRRCPRPPARSAEGVAGPPAEGVEGSVPSRLLPLDFSNRPCGLRCRFSAPRSSTPRIAAAPGAGQLMGNSTGHCSSCRPAALPSAPPPPGSPPVPPWDVPAVAGGQRRDRGSGAVRAGVGVQSCGEPAVPLLLPRQSAPSPLGCP